MNLEPQRKMAASANNGHSEEKFGKPLMENGENNFHARPKYKRRHISAIRDFPEDCGPIASRNEPVLKCDIAGFGSNDGALVEDKSVKHSGGDIVSPKHDNDPQHSEVKKDSFLKETLDQTSDSSLKESPMVSSHYTDGPTLANVELAKPTLVGMDTLDPESATEDCSLKKENCVVSSHQVKANDDPEIVALAGMATLDPESATEDCSLKENCMVSSHQVKANDDPDIVALAGKETLDAEYATEDLVKRESSCISKSSSPVGEVAMSDDSKSLSANNNIAGSCTRMEKPVTLMYPPRRKVSAVRDYPHLCGRNAPRLSYSDCLKQISSLNNKRVGQQNLAVDDNSLKNVAASDVKRVENNIQSEHGYKRKLADIVDQVDSEGNGTERVKKLNVSGPSSETRSPLGNTQKKHITFPEKSNHHQVYMNSEAVVEEENSDTIEVEESSGLCLQAKPLAMSSQCVLTEQVDRLQVSSDRKVVLGVMPKSECPWRSDNGSSKSKSMGGTDGKGKKVDFFAGLDRSKTAIKTKHGLNHSGQKQLKKKKENSDFDDAKQLVMWEKDSLGPDNNKKNHPNVPKSNGLEVTIPPFVHRNFSGHVNDSNARNKVREALRLFQAVFRKLQHELETKPDEGASRRIDLQAANILKKNEKYVNTGKQILGTVPGVEVGDEFHYRVELNVIGLHRALQGGIDYMKHNGKSLATSIVASGGYSDDLDNSDVLVYSGQGGNVMTPGKEPEDQKLIRGNLALKNSSEEKNPVRVIRGSESMDGKSKTYVYDGLYLVESYWQDMGPHGKLIFRFRLRRIPGQPELAWKEVKKSKKFKTREGICVPDISYGKERIPICAVNTIDDEKPPPFKYITSIIYPDWCDLVPSEGCNCTHGCSDVNKCSCVVKNGGEIPFNHNGAIVEAKPLVYECGPKCRCPSSCHNRVSQLGIKFQLEIFKTNARGWGVRSLNSIPSGSFICEYIGEVLEDKEAEQRTGNDEYLFDIGNNKNCGTLWDGLSALMPDSQSHSSEESKDVDVGFTIDAAQMGNVGRFVNHSCSPNLYAQNVLFDHHDQRIPHVMLFAAENIAPLQELSYDYNYVIDQVRDSDGNIKKKYCYCGSVECTGRLY